MVCSSIRELILSPKLADYLPVQTHEPYTFSHTRSGFRLFLPREIFLSHTPVPALGKDKKTQPHAGRTSIRDVIIMVK